MSRRSGSERQRDATGTPSTVRLPTFFVIGAAKAGTSALAASLSAHPEVFMPPEKEIHFFNARYSAYREDGYKRGIDWYRSHFAGAGAQRAVGEATPYYMFDEQAPVRMALAVPEAKLIALLRNPIDRAYSHFWYHRSLFPSPATFAELVRAEMHGEPTPSWLHPFPYLEAGRYLPQLERVCASYPRSSLLTLLFEDLTAAPERTFATVCRFLEIDDAVVPPKVGQVVNPTLPVRSERLRRAMLRMHAWKRLPGPLANAIDRLNRVKAGYPPIEPELRRELAAWYAADNAALGAWLGRDLSAWEA